MTNKLVVIINSLKVPKIKKILLYEMKLLVPNYSCLQNPWLGATAPQIPVLSVLCPKNWICWTPPYKIPGYATGEQLTTFQDVAMPWRLAQVCSIPEELNPPQHHSKEPSDLPLRLFKLSRLCPRLVVLKASLASAQEVIASHLKL